ncbi:IclR family transcriptional regulator [Lentzea sp. E54]|uniref:IclR family transcriptional regulator n=1 Tax=Lentzea xerophila TaxID=3435883 RepID=UPI003DA313F9
MNVEQGGYAECESALEYSVADGERGGRTAATKVLQVLQAFAAYTSPVSLAQLARHTELPKSTTHRMVKFLREAGFVDMVDGHFLLTTKIADLALAVQFPRTEGMREVLLPCLAELYELTHEVVQLVVRCGEMGRVVEQVHGRRSNSLVRQLPGMMPLHCTAGGKVLLACSEPASLRRTGKLHAYTSATITSETRLAAELANVDRNGLAFDRSEWISGMTGVAAPLWGPGRTLLGAIAVVGPVERFVPDTAAARVRRITDIAVRELQAAGYLAREQSAS